MPIFAVWTPGDFGTTGFSTSGTFTMTGVPDQIDVTDDDAIFHDSPNDTSSPPEIGGPQTLTVDLVLDGTTVAVAGDEVYNAAEATITNNTTGEVGQLIYITSNDGGTGAGFLGYATTINIQPGDSFTISALNINEEEEYANLIICFASGTQIITDNGIKPVEALRFGDMLKTKDNDLQAIRWMGYRSLTATDLMRKPNLQPIRIKVGALGENVPNRDLVVSPQHRILVQSKIAERMFNEPEIFMSAKNMLELEGVEIAKDMTSVRYFHIMCDNHEVIDANGAYTETLHTGEQAMKALTPAAREEIHEVFGEVPYLDRRTARPSPKGKFARHLVQRHIKNSKPIQQSL